MFTTLFCSSKLLLCYKKITVKTVKYYYYVKRLGYGCNLGWTRAASINDEGTLRLMMS